MKCCCFLGLCHLGHNKRTGKKARAGDVMGTSRNTQSERESTGKFPTSNTVSVWGKCKSEETEAKFSGE